MASRQRSSTDTPVETPSPCAPLELPNGAAPPLAAIAGDGRERLAVEELLRQQAERPVARDLHDALIQRIYIAGLALNTTIRTVQEPGLAERLGLVVDELDAAIRELYRAALGLTSA